MVIALTFFMAVAGVTDAPQSASANTFGGAVNNPALAGNPTGGSYNLRNCTSGYAVTAVYTKQQHFNFRCTKINTDGSLDTANVMSVNYMGDGGGGNYSAVCSAGKVMVALHAYIQGWLAGAKISCASPIDGSTGLEVVGNAPVNSSSATCAAGTVAIGIQFRAGGYIDAAGPSCQKFGDFPIVSSFAATSTATNSDSISYNLTFRGPVSGLDAGDFAFSGTSGSQAGWSVGAITGTGAGPYSFAVTKTNAAEGTVVLTLALSGVNATAGSMPAGVGTSAAAAVTIDKTAPTVTAFSFTAGSNVQTLQTVSLTFSEPMPNVTADALTLSGVSGGSGTWTETLVSGSGAGPYVFNINNLSAIDGAFQVQVAAGNVADSAGNGVVASSILSRNFTLQPSILPGALNIYGTGTITLAPNATLIDRGSTTLAGLRISVTGSAQASDSLTFNNNNATSFGTIQTA